jgi:predicted Zn finger-like uncharacterized protein
MNVSCPDCRSIFRVDPAKVPPGGVRARCSVCSGIISIPTPTGQGTPTSGSGLMQRQTPTPSSVPSPAPSSVAPATTAPSQGSNLPEFRAPAITPPFRPSAPSPAVTPSAQAFPPATPASPSSAPAPFVPAPPRPSTPARPATTASPLLTPTGSDSGARRPLNPFLSKDPNQRAKRLARALVSDIITYHPAKHAEGLRDGTLKQLFREEIKKSFEEYIAQVGQPLAEGTTYFQEALNEVLGAGKKIF